MTDREKILSNDYYDLLTDFSLPEELRRASAAYVYQPISGEIAVSYIKRTDIPLPMSISNFSYPVIPGIYGLMQTGQADTFDPTPLVRSGITQVQGGTLNLTGKGVVIGFLDTGERVILLPV